MSSLFYRHPALTLDFLLIILIIVLNIVTLTKKETFMIQIVVDARKYVKSVKKDTIWMTITSVRKCRTIVMNVTNMENVNLV